MPHHKYHDLIAGEYVNLSLQEFLFDHVMIHQTFCPNTPHQNGIAERKKLHFAQNLPSSSYWISFSCLFLAWSHYYSYLPYQPSSFKTLKLQNTSYYLGLFCFSSPLTLYQPVFLDVLFLFISLNTVEPNLNLGQLNVYLLAMKWIKRGIDVLILYTIGCILLWILTSFRRLSTMLSIVLGGRLLVMT